MMYLPPTSLTACLREESGYGLVIFLDMVTLPTASFMARIMCLLSRVNPES
jgi:hypothetical protein